MIFSIMAFAKNVFSSLQYKNFRYFWLGQCVSLCGTWMQRTAQVWLIYTLTNSPFLVGLIGVSQFTPMLVFALFSGAIVERIAKKKVLLITQFLFMMQAVCLTVLMYTGHIHYIYVLILSAFFGMVQTFDMPARQSFFIQLVGSDHLMNAISLNSTMTNLAKIIGPALSGIIMVRYGVGFCFLLNSISFFAVLLSLICIKINAESNHGLKAFHLLQEIKEGIRYIKGNKNLKFNVIFMAIICTFAMNLDVVVPVYANEVLHGGSRMYTSLMSAMGIGAMVGAIFMSARAAKGIKKNLFIISIIITLSVQVGMMAVHTYEVAFVLIAGIGFSNLVFMNMGNSIFQLNSDDMHRGRVMSVYSFLNQGSTPLGNLYAGTLMQHIGGRWGFPGCGIMAVFLVGITCFFNKKELSLWLRN